MQGTSPRFSSQTGFSQNFPVLKCIISINNQVYIHFLSKGIYKYNRNMIPLRLCEKLCQCYQLLFICTLKYVSLDIFKKIQAISTLYLIYILQDSRSYRILMRRRVNLIKCDAGSV